METKADPNAYAFLGHEFLTWLWYRCEVDGGVFELPEGEVSLLLNDYVALIAQDGEGEQSILKKGSAHRSAEARTALREGKLVASARLEVARGERSFTVTLDGASLDLRAARYPKPDEENAQDREVERMGAIEELSEIVEGLYGLFLAARTRPTWGREEVPAMEAWIRERAA